MVKKSYLNPQLDAEETEILNSIHFKLIKKIVNDGTSSRNPKAIWHLD